MQEKQLLRNHILYNRSVFDRKSRAADDLAIKNNVADIVNNLMVNDSCLGLYYPLDGEPDLFNMNLHGQTRVSLPQIKDHQLHFVESSDCSDLEKANFGKLMQPKGNNFINPSLIIVPGLSYDLKGYRIGFGKGYYDRYFNDLNDNAVVKIGVCYHEDLREYVPHQDHDVKMDYIITNKIILVL